MPKSPPGRKRPGSENKALRAGVQPPKGASLFQPGGSPPGVSAARSRLTRPQKWVLGLTLLVLALGLANLGRAGVALHYAALLPDLPMTVSWAYLAALGAFWGAAFLACALGLARFRPWGRWATLAAVTLYEAHAWVNHLLFDASDYARQTRPRDLLLTLLLLALVWGSLNWPSVCRAFYPEKTLNVSVYRGSG